MHGHRMSRLTRPRLTPAPLQSRRQLMLRIMALVPDRRQLLMLTHRHLHLRLHLEAPIMTGERDPEVSTGLLLGI